MLVELILAACTECGRPTFFHAECGSGYDVRLGFYYEIEHCFHILKSE